ncbi:MAG: type II secretion system protein N [Pseudomonadota bacterium]|nr:type II secretion system protein N [Pseudomonadota bacterium]
MWPFRKRAAPPWSSTLGTGWTESTFAEKAWVEQRGAGFRWAVAGAIAGGVVGLVAFAPAAWLAQAVSAATHGRIVFADARGTIWSGSAVPVLTGGADSRDASYLPGRLDWSLAPRYYGAQLTLRQACCINGALVIRLRPGFGRMAAVVPGTGSIGQWPNAWLVGLGVPFNTLQLGGTLRLTSPGGFTVESVEGRWRLDGRVDMDLDAVSSRLTTLDTLGSYKVQLNGNAASGGAALLSVSTLDGPLQMVGSGTVGPGGVRFRGEARSAEADEAALANLLNIIGRRDGARSIISIG